MALNLPRGDAPAAGLPAWRLAEALGGPQVVVTRRRAGEPARETPWPGVEVWRVRYPDAEIGARRGPGRAARAALKALGHVVAFLRIAPGLVRFGPHIVHTHTPVPWLCGVFGRAACGARWCVTLHGSEIRWIRRSRFWRAVLCRADHVFVVSRAMATDLEGVVPRSRVSWSPNGVDDGTFHPGADVREPVVLFVGGLRWQKDPLTALEAFARFARRRPNWRLELVGTGPLRRDVVARARALGVDDRVVMRGVLDRRALAERMRAASILLMTSVTEGFPKVLLEAAASATPAVVTDTGECAAIAGSFGRVAPVRDVDTLAAALSELADDADAWRDASRAAREVARAFTWSAAADAVRRVYARLLDDGAPRPAAAAEPQPGG